MDKRGKKEKDFTQETFNSNSIVSANEYTGLIYPAIDDEQKAETYTEEFKITRQKKAEIEESPKKKR